MMLVVLLFFFSWIHKVLLIMTQHHFYLLHLYSLYLFSCLQPFPFMLSSPQLRRKSVCIFHISSCAHGWGCDVADCWINFSPLFVPTFSLLGYWCVVYFQKPKNDFTLSPSLLTWLSCHCWDARDLVSDCHAGHQVTGLALFSHF